MIILLPVINASVIVKRVPTEVIFSSSSTISVSQGAKSTKLLVLGLFVIDVFTVTKFNLVIFQNNKYKFFVIKKCIPELSSTLRVTVD